MTTMDELRTLLSAGTKGKWSVTDEREILSIENRNDPIDGTTYEERTLIAQGECSQNWGYIEWHNLADAALIVAAVNALPGLLDRVERLEAALKQSQEPDMFWDQDDPERPYYSIEELLREREYDRDKDIVIETSEAISCDYGAYLCRIISADEDADDNGPTFSIRKLTEDERKEYRNVERIWYAIRNLKPLFVARAALKEQTP